MGMKLRQGIKLSLIYQNKMSITNLFNRKFYLILAIIFLAELFSLFGYLLSDFNKIGFFIIVLLTIIASLIKLEYGLWILLAELFIGSKGYLFFFEYDGLIISIRIALWLIIMSVWLAKVISNLIKTRKLQIEFFKSSYFSYFIILFLFIAWGVINGFLNNNTISNIFFDFNGWLYFTLVFPVCYVCYVLNRQSPLRETLTRRENNQHFDTPKYQSEQIQQKQYFDTLEYQSGFHTAGSPINSVLQIFTASIIWLSAKTFFLLFAFSHNMIGMTSELYRWVRVSGVGEITQMQGGFYRIFFQSHIFVLIGFFVFILLLAQAINKKDKLDKKFIIYYLLLIIILFSVIVISFSRSFWVGLAIGLLIYWFIDLLVYKASWKKFIITNAILLCAGILSVGLIVAVVKFPYPSPTGGFATTELLSERVSQITGEAGVSSRWALLPELRQEIKRAPILGQGFGATVTYKSSDPRVLQSSPTGEYTTYAFEWGWLDVWLKLGFFGMLAYLILIGKICVNGFKQSAQNKIVLGLIIGLIVISAVSVFSPYMNHPLGIGYLILVSVMILNKSKI